MHVSHVYARGRTGMDNPDAGTGRYNSADYVSLLTTAPTEAEMAAEAQLTHPPRRSQHNHGFHAAPDQHPRTSGPISHVDGDDEATTWKAVR